MEECGGSGCTRGRKDAAKGLELTAESVSGGRWVYDERLKVWAEARRPAMRRYTGSEERTNIGSGRSGALAEIKFSVFVDGGDDIDENNEKADCVQLSLTDLGASRIPKPPARIGWHKLSDGVEQIHWFPQLFSLCLYPCCYSKCGAALGGPEHQCELWKLRPAPGPLRLIHRESPGATLRNLLHLSDKLDGFMGNL
ncbi:hypothetical protein H920_01048 [Fukomys damarensis]|uniref:Uncharacterized protein n=1 Tax=Fukomys damarensis TaxID=885580 RepID=A0A091E4B5_FUKDA|nr:hypothetical protein H920_01048 [Fukomys damarensis]